uniref:Fido domain-containing protein n=1 Tax=Thermosporothrix sp. COM3 TaxID=2490863 RepID=A0A455SKV0_9CHLR|nr:hypothetical protein KTC_15460 [Thermosporothrix sp. COM3]
MNALRQSHPFVDGNKRTALIAGLTFLALNGQELHDAQGAIGPEIERLVITHDVPYLLDWLTPRLQAKREPATDLRSTVTHLCTTYANDLRYLAEH